MTLFCYSRLFTIHPESKEVFIGRDGVDVGRAELHAKAFWRLFDSVFLLLGPDMEFMEEILVQVGQRHRAMGVKPSLFPYMGEAVIYSIEKILKEPLSPKQRDAWDEVYECISNEIIKNMLVD